MAREALLKLKDHFYDIVLLDYKMPELDGFQTLKEIRKLYPDLPVVMMTAYGTVETAVASMKEGALDYLTKPIDLEELLLKFSKGIRKIDPHSRKQGPEGTVSGTIALSPYHLWKPRNGGGHGACGPGGTQSGHGAHPGRERNGKRTDCQCHPLCKSPFCKAPRQGKLRCHS